MVARFGLSGPRSYQHSKIEGRSIESATSSPMTTTSIRRHRISTASLLAMETNSTRDSLRTQQQDQPHHAGRRRRTSGSYAAWGLASAATAVMYFATVAHGFVTPLTSAPFRQAEAGNGLVSGSFAGKRSVCAGQSATSLGAGVLSKLDFKPAVDVYAKFPEPPKTAGTSTGTSTLSHEEVTLLTTAASQPSIVMSLDGPAPNDVDPFALVKKDLAPFSDSIKELVETENPVLTAAAKHFFEKRHGKRFRPTIAMLMSRAVQAGGAIDRDVGGAMATPMPVVDPLRYQRQSQLAQITEMIHVASLIHDDVLDEADTRRGDLAVHKLYSNKVAVLAGDYLLARASVLLARLENVQVVEIMANALDALVQGEIMQAKSSAKDLLDLGHYLRKSYYKTASLICNSCCSAALLGGYTYGSPTTVAAEKYGYHLGLAYQVIDDVLDFTGTADVLGKPAMADMTLGLATAPILYAAEEKKELKPLIKRRFKEQGDVEQTYKLVMGTEGVERAYQLAVFHAQRAVDAIASFPPSEAKDGLIKLAHMAPVRIARHTTTSVYFYRATAEIFFFSFFRRAELAKLWRVREGGGEGLDDVTCETATRRRW
ncbi:Polyprenyl synthetase [Nannochloropsis gaditana]|uniref:Polyprenyl synthetase n=1 Tax=Nannochloropsis gaditana TaxID=72520 RepID=W7TZS0_9STRA|nr:Polyprenyl synthetase [Nannochloropsis gaditana]